LILSFSRGLFLKSSIQGIFKLLWKIFNAVPKVSAKETRPEQWKDALFDPSNHVTIERSSFQNPKPGHAPCVYQTPAIRQHPHALNFQHGSEFHGDVAGS
jgi:hypothetical protein